MIYEMVLDERRNNLKLPTKQVMNTLNDINKAYHELGIGEDSTVRGYAAKEYVLYCCDNIDFIVALAFVHAAIRLGHGETSVPILIETVSAFIGTFRTLILHDISTVEKLNRSNVFMSLLLYDVLNDYKCALKFLTKCSEYTIFDAVGVRAMKLCKEGNLSGLIEYISTAPLELKCTRNDYNHGGKREEVVTMICNKFTHEIMQDKSLYRTAYHPFVQLMVDGYRDTEEERDLITCYLWSQREFIMYNPEISKICANNNYVRVLFGLPTVGSSYNDTLYPLTADIRRFLEIDGSNMFNECIAYTYASLWLYMYNEAPPLNLMHHPCLILGFHNGESINIKTLWDNKFPDKECPRWMNVMSGCDEWL
jgi:hypothetical protein